MNVFPKMIYKINEETFERMAKNCVFMDSIFKFAINMRLPEGTKLN